MSSTYLSIDIGQWVDKTISKVRMGMHWNEAWLQSYFELGGKSEESGKKGCPKNAVRVLYETGQFSGTNIRAANTSYAHIWKNDSKNGVYALLALEELRKDPEIQKKQLIRHVHARTRKMFQYSPKSDQGAIAVTCKLWDLGVLNS